MKVEVLVNLGSNDYPGLPYLAGETREVTEDIGKRLVANGHAREVEVQAPEEPATTEPQVAAVSTESKQDKPAKASLKSSKEK